MTRKVGTAPVTRWTLARSSDRQASPAVPVAGSGVPPLFDAVETSIFGVVCGFRHPAGSSAMTAPMVAATRTRGSRTRAGLIPRIGDPSSDVAARYGRLIQEIGMDAEMLKPRAVRFA